LIEDFKLNNTQVSGDLLNGYSEGEIKDITTTPTGVAVQGQRYDWSMSPVALFEVPPSNDKSGSMTLLPSLAIVFVHFCSVFLIA